MYCFYAIPAIMWLVFCFLLFSSFNPTMISHLRSQDWWETWWPVGLTPSGCWCFGSCNACHNNTWFVANLSGTYCSASRDEAVSTTRTPMVSRTRQSNLKYARGESRKFLLNWENTQCISFHWHWARSCGCTLLDLFCTCFFLDI